MSAMNGWRGYRVLDVLSAACGVIAVVMLVVPASTTVTPEAVHVATTAGAQTGPAGRTAAAIDSLARAIVRTNAFSASRREPTTRFVAPGSEAAMMAPVPAPGGEAPAPVDDESGPQLFGIVSVGGTPRALLQARSASEPPRLLGVGESFGGVRIVRITGDRVVISSSSGTRTLRLSRVVPDSSENVP
jgi:hypothetical protein